MRHLIGRVKQVAPRALHPILRRTYHWLHRAWLHLSFRYCDWRFSSTECQPLPRAALRYKVSETVSIESFVRIGAACADRIRALARAQGFAIEEAAAVLDFGCGCARVLRWLQPPLAESTVTRFHGVDVDLACIEWCRGALPGACFACNDPLPPLPFLDESFDVIYSISVFTHLDEQRQGDWLRELCRLLRRDGLLIFTVHGENAADMLSPEERALLHRAGFLFKRSQKLSGLLPEWYHTSWQSSRYVTTLLAPWFDRIEYHVVADGMQDFVVCRGVRNA